MSTRRLVDHTQRATVSGRTSRRVRALSTVAALMLVPVVLAGCSDLPDPATQQAKGRDQTTVIYDRHGAVLAKLNTGEDRTDVALSRLPASLPAAVVATEDKRFYDHSGVDPLGVLRAVFANAESGSAAQGGSTITQQYVKNAYFTQEKTFSRKMREAMLAQKLEQTKSKDEILELYLNTIYFGHGAYGVEAASRTYFGKPARNLNLAESAMLASVIKSPGTYSPYLHPEAARERRDLVLGLMRDQGRISAEQYASGVAAPVRLAGLKHAGSEAPYFVDYVKARLVDQFGEQAVYRGGLRVKTTLDLDSQHAAERAIAANLDRDGDPSAALVALAPTTGEILAMVGGRDYASQQFNAATDGRRQPGSAFKPFVLISALEEGVSPEERIESTPARIELASGTWAVSGAHDGSRTMRLRRATEKSVNSVFARLIMRIGPQKVADVARDAGITSPLTPVPAIALGGHREGVSPLEMASAYATLAAGGVHATPHGIARVTDAEGSELYRAETEKTDALDPAVAFLTTDILKGVLTDGTGGAAQIGRPAAGKTGTTQAYRDAWFAGYTPEVAASVWVGYPDEQREMRDVHGIQVTGGSFPARIWHDFMKAALADVKPTDFERPEGLVRVRVCASSGQRANEACPVTLPGLFLTGHTPDMCTQHQAPVRVTVPDVVGLKLEQARARLGAVGLKASVQTSASADASEGTVLSQRPRPGTSVDKGASVTIVVARSAPVEPPQPTLDAIITGPRSGRVGEELSFSGSSSKGAPVEWSWDLGDGSASAERDVAHIFAAPGRYTVSLTVRSADGASDGASIVVTIKP